MKIIGIEYLENGGVLATLENGVRIQIENMDEEEIEAAIEKRLKEISH